jgi:hypothetical protein
MEKTTILVPRQAPADILNALLAGRAVEDKPRSFPSAHVILNLMTSRGMTVEDAERLLSLFLEKTYPDEDERKDVWEVVRDILDNPENAHDHYTTFNLRKKDGGFRVIEAPEPTLKKLQRTILLNWWYARRKPPEYVQGFVPTRGTFTNATAHIKDGVVGKDKVLIKVDIRDFFMSVTRTSIMNRIMNKMGHWMECGERSRFPSILIRMYKDNPERMPGSPLHSNVLDRFMKDGVDRKEYPEHAASVIACRILLDWILLRLCCLDERLPQGSPCSPALANMFMEGTTGIIRKRLSYALVVPHESTIYADDLTTTIGPKATDEDVEKTRSIMVSSIMSCSDISVNYKKIGVFRHGHSQKVTGIMITDKISISRQERDKVRAELHNAAIGKKTLTDEDKARLRGVRAWMRGVDIEGWDSRCEKDFQKAVGV